VSKYIKQGGVRGFKGVGGPGRWVETWGNPRGRKQQKGKKNTQGKRNKFPVYPRGAGVGREKKTGFLTGEISYYVTGKDIKGQQGDSVPEKHKRP